MTPTKGTLTLVHNNFGGGSSIVFPSKNNYTSDFGYIRYRDDVNNNGAGYESARFEIGTENDADDHLILQKGIGYVGIGTVNPAYKLHVAGTLGAGTTSLGTTTTGSLSATSITSSGPLSCDTRLFCGGEVVAASSYSTQGAYVSWNLDNGGGRTYFVNNKGGGGGGWNFIDVTTSTGVCASITQSGSYSGSDYRIKENIKIIDVSDGIYFVNNIDSVTYNMIGQDQLSCGYIAQDVLKYGFDHLVETSKNEELEETTYHDFVSPKGIQYMLNYSGIIPYHGVVIKHLLKENEELKSRLSAIEARLGI